MNGERRKKYYCLMLFRTEFELGKSLTPGVWVNTDNLYFDDGYEAIEAYANTRCPASQLIDAESKEELDRKVEEMKANYADREWLETNLYPFL